MRIQLVTLLAAIATGYVVHASAARAAPLAVNLDIVSDPAPAARPMAPGNAHSNAQRPFKGGKVEIIYEHTLADTLTLEKRASLWWDYARDVPDITSRLVNKGVTTLLVPLDSAIMALPHKPHQNPSGEQPADEAETRTNVENFLTAHIVPGAVRTPSDGAEYQTLHPGVKVTVQGEEGDYKVYPGGISVVAVKEAKNGKILYLDGVVQY